MWKNPHSLFKMTLEVVYPAVHRIKAESTAIQVEAKRLIQRVTPSSRSSRSSDHRRSRRHSPEYDRREGRAVSRRYTDDKDYRDRSEPSPRQGRDNRDYDIKSSRYESSRTPVFFSLVELSSGWKPLQRLDKMMSCWHRTLRHLLQQMLTLKRWFKWVPESRKDFH